MHGRGSLPSETDGNQYLELPQRLTSACRIRMGTYCSQVIVAQTSGEFWPENQLSQELTDSQTVSVLFGNSYKLSSDANLDYAGMLHEHSASWDII